MEFILYGCLRLTVCHRCEKMGGGEMRGRSLEKFLAMVMGFENASHDKGFRPSSHSAQD